MPDHEDVKKLRLARKVCAKYMEKLPIEENEGGLAILSSMSVAELEVLLQDYSRRFESVQEDGPLERHHLLRLIADQSLGGPGRIRKLAEDLNIDQLREIAKEPMVATKEWIKQ